MKASSHFITKYSLWLLFILLLPASAIANQAEGSLGAQRAKELWEQAIVAKGGRERLYKVNSLLVSYQSTWRNFFGIETHSGITEWLFVFPDKSWGWTDYPPPMKPTVGMANLERNINCIMFTGATSATCKPTNESSNFGLIYWPSVYLMETKWVKPQPTKVLKGASGLSGVDVVQTLVNRWRVDYYLDRKTHLPRRVVTFFENGRVRETYNFSDYIIVDGVQMPNKQEKGRISFQINPPYDGDIFTRPPSIKAGPKAWQRAVTPTP